MIETAMAIGIGTVFLSPAVGFSDADIHHDRGRRQQKSKQKQ
jgi:hypothetical protein